jgi:hypothetical protein
MTASDPKRTWRVRLQACISALSRASGATDNRTGALSGMSMSATCPTAVAPMTYHAGAKALPVT